MSSDKDYLAGLPPKFEFVRVDPNSKTRFILRCRECGYEFSRIKYSISNKRRLRMRRLLGSRLRDGSPPCLEAARSADRGVFRKGRADRT